jgi:hypothetical protein
MPAIKEILTNKVVLDIECVDRVYLNGYVKYFQMPGGLITFIGEQIWNRDKSVKTVLPPFRTCTSRHLFHQAVPTHFLLRAGRHNPRAACATEAGTSLGYYR